MYKCWKCGKVFLDYPENKESRICDKCIEPEIHKKVKEMYIQPDPPCIRLGDGKPPIPSQKIPLRADDWGEE